jgi:ATP-dependent helicase HrpB
MLPIYAVEEEIVRRLKEQPRLVVCAPTGSGKSTQVPQMLLRHGVLDQGQVVILQPRRIAARLLAARVAQELGAKLGHDVGYQVRFENVTSAATRIRYVTEGILLRQMISNPELTGISTVIFDEFHERHLYGDITLARALDLRPDLNIIVMSATLDVDALAKYLHPCSIVKSEGRMYPVDIRYEPGKGQVWDLAADAFERHSGEGDALVFMPGAYEIHRTLEALRPVAKGRILLPLHGELPPRDQDAAVARYDKPKVVVATNVAETSLTIEGITLVIDSGLARIPRYDPYRGINTLLIENISRASADQRAGRAGRTAPGVCVRLWSDRDPRPLREQPEIKRLDLSEVVLTIRAAGLRTLRWLDPPDEKALAHAEELLTDLGALKDGGITTLGRRMLAFPVHPRYSRMLLAAQEFGCVYEAALIASLTQERVRVDPSEESDTSDFFGLMKKSNPALLQQFLRIAEEQGLDVRRRGASEESMRKCILIGFSDRVAKRADNVTLRCDLVHGRSGVLARESVVRRHPLLVAAEVREVEGKTLSTILSLATAIEADWLKQLFPDDINTRPHVFYDPASKRVYAEEQVRFRDLVLEKRSVDPPLDAAARLLADEVLSGRLKLRHWDDSVEQWILRVNQLKQWCPELDIEPLTDRRLLVEDLCHGAAGFKDVKDRPVDYRSWIRRPDLVDKHAPERLELSNGKRPKMTYVPDGPPFLSAKIQDLYGIHQSPKIAMGRVTPLIHILAPNMRPVQITQDLGSFWREHYPQLKKEMQRRYPKHDWR